MTSATRLKLLLGAFFGIASLFVFDPVPLEAGAQGVAPPRENKEQVASLTSHRAGDLRGSDDPTADAQTSTQILSIRPREMAAAESSAFAQKDWTPPPPPPPPAAAPPPPQAPSLPFTYIGKQLVDGTWTVFLSYQKESAVAREGQTLADSYRIERINPPMMTLIYLPLNQKQYLPIGPAL